MNLLIVGSEEPRKRLDFAIEAVALLPEDIRSKIIIHKIGAESSLASRKELEELAMKCQVELNWLGRMEQEELYAAYQHTNGLLFLLVLKVLDYRQLKHWQQDHGHL